MHRVELKAASTCVQLILTAAFLMHRVELKALFAEFFAKRRQQFLMHRVELKVGMSFSTPCLTATVPNAPCGVEREED